MLKLNYVFYALTLPVPMCFLGIFLDLPSFQVIWKQSSILHFDVQCENQQVYDVLMDAHYLNLLQDRMNCLRQMNVGILAELRYLFGLSEILLASEFGMEEKLKDLMAANLRRNFFQGLGGTWE